MPLKSMTGFANAAGGAEGLDWVWEVRSVNARGFDLRVRLPEGLDVLEPQLRKAMSARFARGSITVALRVQAGEDAAAATVNAEGLAAVLKAAKTIRDAAEMADLDIAPLSIGDLMAQRSVFEAGRLADRLAAQAEAIAADIAPLVDGLDRARTDEGVALKGILTDQIARIRTLCTDAKAAADARGPEMAAALKTRIATLLAATDRVDEDRLAQELALLAVKADVTEELDRLQAHVVAAEGHLAADGPVGRKLDFLCQEFNREANTLCSKSGSADLTSIGLELKVVIDQMREQCQNVE